MTCPICGCKMPQKTMCIYCKITGDQVENASNKLAKQKLKKHDKEGVYYSTTMPKDVNKTKLMLFTILLGIFGVGNFYVGKYIKGAYCVSSWVLFMPFGVTNLVIQGSRVFSLLSELTAIFVVLTLLFWISDIIALLAKVYKVPVVLGEKKKK